MFRFDSKIYEREYYCDWYYQLMRNIDSVSATYPYHLSDLFVILIATYPFFLDRHTNFISLECLSILFFWVLLAFNLYSLFIFQQFVIHLCLCFNSLLFSKFLLVYILLTVFIPYIRFSLSSLWWGKKDIMSHASIFIRL